MSSLIGLLHFKRKCTCRSHNNCKGKLVGMGHGPHSLIMGFTIEIEIWH